MVGDPYDTPDVTFATRGQVAHIRLGSSWDATCGMFGSDLRFALVAFDLVSDSIWCEGVGACVGARGGSTWPGEDYSRGALGWEKPQNLWTTNKARSHKHTQVQTTQPHHRGPPSPIPTAFQQHRRRRKVNRVFMSWRFNPPDFLDLECHSGCRARGSDGRSFPDFRGNPPDRATIFSAPRETRCMHAVRVADRHFFRYQGRGTLVGSIAVR